MRLPKLSIATFIALLTVVADTSISFYSLTSLPVPKVLAQTNSEKKAEADRLFLQGLQQGQTKQFREALQSLQQALVIYREIGDRKGEGFVLVAVSATYVVLREDQKALDSSQQSLAIARELRDPKLEQLVQELLSKVQQQNNPRKAEADRLLQQGLQQYGKSLFREALQSWQQALIIYREIGDREGEGAALGNLGLAYYSQGDYRKAIEYYQQSLAIAREIGYRRGEGQSLRNLGLAYGSQGDYRKAIEYHQQGLAIAREIGDREGEGQSLGNLGIAYISQGDYRKAIEYQQQHLAIAREIGDRNGEGQSLGNLGAAFGSLGDYRKAIEYYQQSLAIAREIGYRRGEGNALGNLGNAYNSLGDYRKAIEYYQQSLAILREIGDRNGEGGSLGNLGVAYGSQGDYRKAIEYQQQSLAIAREIGDRKGEGAALGNLGNAYNSLGDYRKAIEYHQQFLAIAREIGDREGEGAALGNLGLAYNSLGDYRKAIEYHQQFLAIAREIGDRKGEGAALGNLGAAFGSQGDYRKAIEYQQQSLAIAREIGDRKGEGAVLRNLGLAYNSLGDYRKAIEYYQQSLAIAREIGDLNGEGAALGNLGVAYGSLGDYRKAIEYQQQSLAIAREIGDLNGEGASLNNLGAAFYKSGDLAQAEKTLFQGIEVQESLRERLGDDDANKVSIFEEQARTYRLLQEVLIAQNKTTTALEISERGRGRAFVELLTRRLSTNPKEIIPAASLKPTIDQIKQIAQKQNATLVQYSIIFDGFKIPGRVQAKESELYIWVIKPTGEVNFRKVDLKPLWQQQNTSLGELVTNTRDSIGVRSRATAIIALKPGVNEKQRLQKLHEILIKPIADLLPTDPNNHVIFIPQRELFLVPFVALQDEIGKHLIEKHTILTAPSIQVLELTHAKKAEMQQSRGAGEKSFQNLIVGNPTMPSLTLKIGEPPEQLPSLPGAQEEAIEIGKLFNTQPLIGSQATEATIKSQISQANIIHFATHGLLDYGELQGKYRAGVPGALAFTPDEKEDGLLTSDEILDLKLNASLVVLSACDTGRGQLTGDGVVGLSRAFITAGTPSIVVSLWAVPDKATTDLMKEFYQQMRTNPNKAQALRQAMLTMMKTRPHPKDWAAFTFIGEAY
jgi:tetratricopeptide (TPR) repeat protein